MKNSWWKIAVVVVLVVAVIAVVAGKNNNATEAAKDASGLPKATMQSATASAKSSAIENIKGKLPRMVDLGSKNCIPCKMMKPILEELRNEYKGKLTVEFIDVFENRAAGNSYGISSIPTQVFYDKNGKEFSRHTGFISKEDIVATFGNRGIKLDN
jgi:thioredoxin 1